MDVYTDLPEQPLDDTVLTAGMFDGVHRGHQVLIQEACTWAEETGVSSSVLTFTARPDKDVPVPCVMPVKKRISLIEETGADICIALPLTPDISSMEPEEFIKETAVGRLGGRRIVAGEDWRFGRDRSGTVGMLRQMEEKGIVAVRIIEDLVDEGVTVSSTAIRDAVRNGDLALAERLLGRKYCLSGEVVHGSGRGKELGFPTANIATPGLVTPPYGIYAARAVIDGVRKPAVASMGVCPTFGGDRPTLEVHIFDFEQDLYGKFIDVEPVSYLREEKAFPSAEELVDQMARDCEKARQNLS